MKHTLLFLFVSIQLIAQNNLYTHQVFVLNEGYQDYLTEEIIVPVTLGTYNPVNETYTIVDTIDGARFASDILIEGQFVYVAADKDLLKYDKDTYELISSQEVTGIRNIAIWNDYILISRGEYDPTTFGSYPFESFLQVYDKHDLSFVHQFDTINGPKWSAQNIQIVDDKAFVTINNGFQWGSEKGLIAEVDLELLNYVAEYDLGVDGKNPDNLMKSNGFLYTVNNKDWNSSSISKMDLTTGDITTTNLSTSSTNGCGTSCMRFNDKIYYQHLYGTNLYVFDVMSNQTIDSINTLNLSYYGLDVDSVNNIMYASVTDFLSSGYVQLIDENNVVVGSFDASVSPGNFAFDIREDNINILENNKSYFSIYPNPASDYCNIVYNNVQNCSIEILDVLGNIVLNKKISEEHTKLKLNTLNKGFYIINLYSSKVLIGSDPLILN